MSDWIAHRSHKYIKREMVGGKWRYWYKLPSKRATVSSEYQKELAYNSKRNEIPVEKTNWAELDAAEHAGERQKPKNTTRANPKELSGKYRRGEQFVEKRLTVENINNKVAKLFSLKKKKK